MWTRQTPDTPASPQVLLSATAEEFVLKYAAAFIRWGVTFLRTQHAMSVRWVFVSFDNLYAMGPLCRRYSYVLNEVCAARGRRPWTVSLMEGLGTWCSQGNELTLKAACDSTSVFNHHRYCDSCATPLREHSGKCFPGFSVRS